MAVSLNRLSREYLWWKITTTNDLSGSTAEVAFMSEPGILPDTLDWNPATVVVEGANTWVRVLVSGAGAGGDVELMPDDYQSWVRIEDAVERPVRQPGVVTIT